MDPTPLARLMSSQDGVVSRRQVLEAGSDDSFIERRLRRKDWARVHRGGTSTTRVGRPGSSAHGQPEGVQIHRVTDLAEAVQPSRSLPRVRLERALVDVASAARDDAEAVAVLADACQAGWTTPLVWPCTCEADGDLTVRLGWQPVPDP